MTHLRRHPLALLAAIAFSLAGACDRTSEPAGDEPPQTHAHDQDGHDHHHGDHDHHASDPGGDTPTSLAELPEGINAVQHEMRLLDEAMRTILTLLADRDLEGIPAQVMRVHPARNITLEAIEAGAYQPPARPEDLAEFKALDDVFHDDLKALIEAANQNDLDAATEAYVDLVRGCTSCHTEFRF